MKTLDRVGSLCAQTSCHKTSPTMLPKINLLAYAKSFPRRFGGFPNGDAVGNRVGKDEL